MLTSKKEPQSINFLEPVYSPTDIWSKAYIWLTDVGKYLLIGVEIIVLGVFFSRFILDRKNNDLTEEINDKVALLSNESWKQKDVLFGNYQALLTDVRKVRENQTINSTIISDLISGIPSLLSLDSFSFTEDRVFLSLTSTSFETVKNYETALKNNPDYKDVTFNIVKEKSDIGVKVTFSLISK